MAPVIPILTRWGHISLSAMATEQQNNCYERIVAGILATILEKGKPAVGPRRKARARARGRSQQEGAVLLIGECW